MSFLKKNRLLVFGLLAIALVGIPTTVVLFQQTTELRSRAEKTAVLSFAPPSSEATPIQVQNGDTFSLDMFVNPGNNLVSVVKVELLYDPTKFEVARGLPFQPNQSAFTQLVEGPVYENGKVKFTLSIGTDLSRAIRQQTRFGTISFRAINTTSETPSLISYGQSTQVFSLSANSTPTENVIASTLPATIMVGNPPCVTRPACLDGNPKCLLAEPSAGWCPAPPTPTPTSRVTPTPAACKNASIDAMLVIDKSGSMNDRVGGNKVTKMTGAKAAAKNFVGVLAADTKNNIALTSFSNSATVNSTFTNNFSSVKSKIDSLSANGYTCIQCAINKANQEISSKGRSGMKKVVVLLTDGRANWIEGTNKQVNPSLAEQKAVEAANAGHNANGTVFYTIGLGNDVNANFLKNIADSTGGKYYFSPTADQLNEIYTQISQVVAKGSISGFVFNDVNNNGAFNNEPKLKDWELQLTAQGATTPQTLDSDEDGNFNFTGLCDGTYTLKQTVKSNWKQTTPANNSNYTIAIANGNAVTDKNFGNVAPRCSDGIDNDNNGFIDDKDSSCHSDGNPKNPDSYVPGKDGENGGGNTCADSKDNNNNTVIDGADPVCHTDGDADNPNTYDPELPETTIPTLPPVTISVAPSGPKTPLSLNLFLHGIGASGDNANPDESSLSNKNPVHQTRQVELSLYDANNDLLTKSLGNVTYSSASGSYKGIVDATNVPTGFYTVRVKMDQHLTRAFPGIQSLTGSQPNSLPEVALITGDSNSDNKLNIIDYNMLLDCYSDLAPATACDDPTKKVATDANDDASVNQIDYNLFLREISTQPGQ